MACTNVPPNRPCVAIGIPDASPARPCRLAGNDQGAAMKEALRKVLDGAAGLAWG